eukprot:6759798-Pyramimonas_sp.AAC.1
MPAFRVYDFEVDAVKTSMPLNVSPSRLLVQPTPEVLEWVFMKALATEKPDTRAYLRPVVTDGDSDEALGSLADGPCRGSSGSRPSCGSSGSAGPSAGSANSAKRRRK